MAILQKDVLVNYIITKYKEKFNGNRITPIKLQKSLYFLYAYWGGKIRSQQLKVDCDRLPEMTEMEFDYSEDLFDANFEAWAYGPVDREIYVWFKELSDAEYSKISNRTLHNVDDFVLGYVDDLINKIFNTNDFALVDLSHQDKCWSSVYDSSRKIPMKNEEIKDEYAL